MVQGGQVGENKNRRPTLEAKRPTGAQRFFACDAPMTVRQVRDNRVKQALSRGGRARVAMVFEFISFREAEVEKGLPT